MTGYSAALATGVDSFVRGNAGPLALEEVSLPADGSQPTDDGQVSPACEELLDACPADNVLHDSEVDLEKYCSAKPYSDPGLRRKENALA